MEVGHWQVVVEEEAHELLEIFTPEQKRRWKVMPMGGLNAAPACVAMMTKLHMEWDTLAKVHGMKNFASKIIVDDVLLYVGIAKHLIAYFRTVLDVLKQHFATLKKKKYKWFQNRCEFLGMDVAAGGTQPAQSKNEAFEKLERPNTREYLRMLIGTFRV